MERGMFVGKYGANHMVIQRAYLGNMIFFKTRYLFTVPLNNCLTINLGVICTIARQ